jgi:hypothetical protein
MSDKPYQLYNLSGTAKHTEVNFESVRDSQCTSCRGRVGLICKLAMSLPLLKFRLPRLKTVRAAVPDACFLNFCRPEPPVNRDVPESETQAARNAVVIVPCGNAGWIEANFGARQNVRAGNRQFRRFCSVTTPHWRRRTARKRA